MSAGYKAVQWNRHKLVYDACAIAAILLYLLTFTAVAQLRPPADQRLDPAITLMRATGSGAFALLTIILCIGPLARLSPRLSPLLYNRRHLGVATFALALLHALLVVGYYHAFGDTNPLVSLLVNTTRAGVPFELLGLAALAILFLMAATSHDFWLANLSPRAWKSIHMLVYPAYALLIAHVAFGAMQRESSFVIPALLIGALALVSALHLATGLREFRRDRAAAPTLTRDNQTWIDAASIHDIPADRAVVVCPKNAQRVAIFRHNNTLSAVSNVCAHQQGPLGEGAIIDGCITCPWHAYQYLPDSGTSPPPFTEKIPTYELRIEGDRVLLNPNPRPPGTHIAPVPIPPRSTTPASP